jgi:hypothetical protein
LALVTQGSKVMSRPLGAICYAFGDGAWR